MKADINRPNIGDYSRPTIIQALVTDITIRPVDSFVVCDVVDNLGNFHAGVETIASGGGGESTFASMPYQVGQSVYLIQMSHNEQPYILGSVYKPANIVPSRDIQFSDTGEDRHNVGVGDYAIGNKGNLLNLTEEDGIIASANKDIRLQIGRGGILRISKAGLCDDYPLKGAAFITVLHNYLEEIRAVQDQIKEMQTDITANISVIHTTLASAATSLVTPVGGLPPGSPDSVTAAAGVITTGMNSINTAITRSTAQDSALQNLPIRDASVAGQEANSTICTSIRLPKTPE